MIQLRVMPEFTEDILMDLFLFYIILSRYGRDINRGPSTILFMASAFPVEKLREHRSVEKKKKKRGKK